MKIFEEYENRFDSAKLSLPKRKPWKEKDREEIRKQVYECLHFDDALIPQIKLVDIEPQIKHSDISLTIGENCITTSELAQKISGITPPENAQLQDACMPLYKGNPIDESTIVSDLGRGNLMRVFAQFELSLKK